jgi:hypothetical protein
MIRSHGAGMGEAMDACEAQGATATAEPMLKEEGTRVRAALGRKFLEDIEVGFASQTRALGQAKGAVMHVDDIAIGYCPFSSTGDARYAIPGVPLTEHTPGVHPTRPVCLPDPRYEPREEGSGV